MYDINWARRVYNAFRIDCPRTINLNNCIVQRAWERHQVRLTPLEVEKAIIFDVQRGGKQHIWRSYKRMVKKTTFSTDILDVFLKEFLGHKADYVAFTQQLSLF